MEHKTNDKLGYVRILLRLMQVQDISTMDLARMISRSQRHVQYCFDLTRDTELTASEFAVIVGYFSSLGSYDLLAFLAGSSADIEPPRYGKASGRVQDHVLQLHKLTAELNEAFTVKDFDSISQLEMKIKDVLANVSAEKAELLRRTDSVIRARLMACQRKGKRIFNLSQVKAWEQSVREWFGK